MELEIKVMWCKGLSSFNFFQKLTVYAAVSITSENERLLLTENQKQEQKTSVDEEGDGNPEWNHSMKFDLQPLKSLILNFKDLCLVFELRNQGQLFGDKTIGEVRVPLTELIQSVGGDIVRFVSYEVRIPEGKHNGILDFSYKVIGNNDNINNTNNINSIHNINGYHDYHQHHHQEHESHDHGINPDIHVIEYHHHHHHHHSQLDSNNTNSDNGYHHHHNSQLDGNNTISDTHHVMGYHHHLQLLDGNATTNTYSDAYIMGYHHHHQQHSQLDGSASEVIQYPKIDLQSIYPPPSSISSSFTATSAHYPPAPALYPPPPPQMWADTPPPPSHYPPSQPYVYPPPPQQQPYGVPHWGYQRPPHHW